MPAACQPAARDWAATVSAVGETAVHQSGKGGVARRMVCTGSGKAPRAAVAALEIVVRNLVDNAIKYSNEPVHIRIVATRATHGGVELEISDHGIGIEKKHLGRIFHRFYRVENDTVRQRRGTGLGLFVVSALVRQLGGRIEARSAGMNHGTTMRVMLPAKAIQAGSAD